MAAAFKCDSCQKVLEGVANGVSRVKVDGFEVLVCIYRPITADERAAKGLLGPLEQPDDFGADADLCPRCMADILRNFQLVAEPYGVSQ